MAQLCLWLLTSHKILFFGYSGGHCSSSFPKSISYICIFMILNLMLFEDVWGLHHSSPYLGCVYMYSPVEVKLEPFGVKGLALYLTLLFLWHFYWVLRIVCVCLSCLLVFFSQVVDLRLSFISHEWEIIHFYVFTFCVFLIFLLTSKPAAPILDLEHCSLCWYYDHITGHNIYLHGSVWKSSLVIMFFRSPLLNMVRVLSFLKIHVSHIHCVKTIVAITVSKKICDYSFQHFFMIQPGIWTILIYIT